jgi:integrase
LPKERSKNGRALTLPLPPAAWQIIEDVPKMVNRECLFGVRSNVGFNTWALSKQSLDTRCGVADWHVHDIRRSVATKMADKGVAPHIIETILNHTSGHKKGVAGIYNKSVYEREVKAALALWANRVRVLGGRRKVPSGSS